MDVPSRMMRGLRLLLKGEGGGAMIEFAILLPVLLLIFAGATEIGRLFYTYTTLAKATKVGARYLSTQLSVDASSTACGTAGSACSNARNLVVCGNAGGCGGTGQPKPIVKNLTVTNVAIDPPTGAITATKYVTVRITGYTYTPWIFNLARMTGAPSNQFTISLTPSNRMRYMR